MSEKLLNVIIDIVLALQYLLGAAGLAIMTIYNRDKLFYQKKKDSSSGFVAARLILGQLAIVTWVFVFLDAAFFGFATWNQRHDDTYHFPEILIVFTVAAPFILILSTFGMNRIFRIHKRQPIMIDRVWWVVLMSLFILQLCYAVGMSYGLWVQDKPAQKISTKYRMVREKLKTGEWKLTEKTYDDIEDTSTLEEHNGYVENYRNDY